MSWLSEFPHEAEILFAPLTGMEVRGSRVEGAMQVYEVVLTVNMLSLTIEQVIGKRHKLLLDMGSQMEVELAAEVASDSWTTMQVLRSTSADDAKETLKASVAHLRTLSTDALNNDELFNKTVAQIVEAKRSIAEWPHEASKLVHYYTGGDFAELDAKPIITETHTGTAALMLLEQNELQPQWSGPSVAGALRQVLFSSSSLLTVDCGQNTHTQLGPLGAKHLAPGLAASTTLRKLMLRGNKLSTAGAIDIVRALQGNTSLTWLDLSINTIFGSDGFPEDVAALLTTNTTLLELDLLMNPIIQDSEGLAVMRRAAEVHTPPMDLLVDGQEGLHNRSKMRKFVPWSPNDCDYRSEAQRKENVPYMSCDLMGEGSA